jgi:MscS family membrane protein
MNFVLKLLLLIVLLVASHYIEEMHVLPRWENLIMSLLNFAIFVTALNLIYNSVLYYYRRGKKMTTSQRDNITTVFQNIYLLIVGLGFIFMALRSVGIDIVAFLTSLSIVAAAIAIVFKDYISPVIAGFLIAFSREINIDDYIQVGSQKGKVINMSLTKLSLLNEDDDMIILANDNVYQSDLVNYTRGNVRKVSINFDLGHSFKGSVEELESNLINALVEYHDVIEQDSFNLRIVAIHKDSLELKFQYILTKVDRILEREIRKKTVRQVVNYLRTSSLKED